MPTIKQNKLGGLGIPSTDLEQDPSKFRDLRNVVQDADGEYYTRSGDVSYVNNTNQTLNQIQPGKFSAEYAVPYVAGDKDEDVLLFTRATDMTTMPMYPTYSYALDNDELVIWDFKTGQRRVGQCSPRVKIANSQISYTELNNVLYFNFPETTDNLSQGLFKWDGYKWHRAGLPKCAVASTTTLSTDYTRTFYGTIDFKGNVVYGGFTQAGHTPASGVLGLNLTKAGSASPAPTTDVGGYLDLGFDDRFIKWFDLATYDAGNNTFTVPCDQGNLRPGDWLQFYPGSGSQYATEQQILVSLGFYIPTILAMQCIDVIPQSGYTDYVFRATEDTTLVWVDASSWSTFREWRADASTLTTISSYATLIGGLNSSERLTKSNGYISNTWAFMFSSTSPNSGYRLRDARPIAYLANSYNITFLNTANATHLVPYSPFSGLSSSVTLLENVIDDTTVNTPFPKDIKYITQQNGNLLAATDNVVYFSSVDLGSSPENTDGLANFVPGSIKDGIITGIGATESFVFCSREKRNYSVVGNIYTGNFQVQPYREAQPGTTDFNNVISVNDTVFFSNQFGLFAATASQLTPVGRDLTGLYTKSGTVRKALNGTNLGPFRLRDASYDYTRNLISWKLNDDKILMINLNTGQFYIWDWSVNSSCQFIQGKYWSAKRTIGAENALLYSESAASTATFGTSFGSYLVTTWITLGEPSLEKQFTQIKWFVKATSNLTASVFSDWDYTNKIQSSEVYLLNTNSSLSQKHKIKSNKSLAISISIECPAGQRMQIQGYELEFNPIQEGMKR
jgi:hypothetical protein